MTVADQAQRLRQLVEQAGLDAAAPPVSRRPGIQSAGAERPIEAPKARAQVIAVASGKGGVGKTNVAVNLAVRLAQMGRRVALVDADMGLANADVLCGVTATHNLSHVLMGRRVPMESVAVDVPGGFRLIPGASGIRELADLPEDARRRLHEELTGIERDCDVLIIDAAAGIATSVVSLASLADRTLIVVTPEPTSIADAYGLIKSIHRLNAECPLALLINQVADEAQARRVHDRIARVARQFLSRPVDYAGYVPFDPAVRHAVQQRRPFALLHPTAPASTAMTRLAHRIDRHAAAESKPSTGFFRRLFGRRTG